MNLLLPESDEEIKMIMNGWYTHWPQNFPPVHGNLNPLLISMYVADHAKEAFASPANQEFFKKFGPVGARCPDTMEYFKNVGEGG